MTETVLQFGPSFSLIGIRSTPSASAAVHGLPAVILLNAGLVHRVGPNRLYVDIARSLAAVGFTVLRFDLSGKGDSGQTRVNLSLKQAAVEDVRCAMDLLREESGASAFVLGGLCSGADASFEIACRDCRVCGALLINPPSLNQAVPDPVFNHVRNLHAARGYLRHSLWSAGSWHKFLTGRANYAIAAKAVASAARRAFQFGSVNPPPPSLLALFGALKQRNVRLWLVYSSGDPGLDCLRALLGDSLRGLLASGVIRLKVIRWTDHTFTPRSSRQNLLNQIHAWMCEEWIDGKNQGHS